MAQPCASRRCPIPSPRRIERAAAMCLIAWSWQPGQARTLLLAANRDEWLDRPTLP
ncbi:NRDE family protein, partial [Acidithiobacillus sp.]|uniref:NRDE family protein n=1 Tax=Acidithiobacillus sp. TaxID=1872118 RepID=UPI003453DC07